MSFLSFLFFFSSRRRHARYIGDWSSDVCSSDLLAEASASHASTSGSGSSGSGSGSGSATKRVYARLPQPLKYPAMADHDLDTLVRRARGWIAEAERVVVLTGAGISTESGIPDFRGPQGVWTKNPEAEKQATIQHYVADKDVRKRAWQSRLETFGRRAQPNAGHQALVALERRGKLDTLITQNVDGLHQAAGSTPARVVEVHGTTREVVCLACGERAPMERALARVQAGENDPPCRTCGGILKSATISFGQGLVPEDIARADCAARWSISPATAAGATSSSGSRAASRVRSAAPTPTGCGPAIVSCRPPTPR